MIYLLLSTLPKDQSFTNEQWHEALQLARLHQYKEQTVSKTTKDLIKGSFAPSLHRSLTDQSIKYAIIAQGAMDQLLLHGRQVLHTANYATTDQLLLSQIYCQSMPFARSLYEAWQQSNFHCSRPLLRPVLDFIALLTLKGSSLFSPKQKESPKSKMAEKHFKTIIYNNPDIETTLPPKWGYYSKKYSAYILETSPEVVLSTMMHEWAHALAKFILPIAKDPDFVTIVEDLQAEAPRCLQPEVTTQFRYAFSDCYQAHHEYVEEIFVRFFELVARGFEVQIMHFHPQLYQYMTEHMIPYINIMLHAFNADENLNNCLIGSPTIKDTLASYKPTVLKNIAYLILSNRPEKGDEMLNILYSLGLDFSLLSSHEAEPYAATITRYQSIYTSKTPQNSSLPMARPTDVFISPFKQAMRTMFTNFFCNSFF